MSFHSRHTCNASKEKKMFSYILSFKCHLVLYTEHQKTRIKKEQVFYLYVYILFLFHVSEKNNSCTYWFSFFIYFFSLKQTKKLLLFIKNKKN